MVIDVEMLNRFKPVSADYVRKIAKERALEPQGQALPVHMVCYQNLCGPSETGKWREVSKEVYETFAPENRRILYASQLALPAGPVPEGWKEAIEGVRTRMENDTPSAYDNSGYREYAGVILDAVEDQLHALASPSPAEEGGKS